MPSPAQTDGQPENKKSGIFLGLLTILVGFFFILFMGLGIWQVERLQWKLDLIARVDARVHAEPVAAPGPDDWANVNQKDDEYRHVTLTGTYLNDKEVLVHALTEARRGLLGPDADAFIRWRTDFHQSRLCSKRQARSVIAAGNADCW